MSHEYKRHCTTTQSAAVDVLDGEVIAHHKQRHHHTEWLKFRGHLDRETPQTETLHLICDNYSTHKHPEVQQWLAQHPRFPVHVTPMCASWLNMVERLLRDRTDQRSR